MDDNLNDKSAGQNIQDLETLDKNAPIIVPAAEEGSAQTGAAKKGDRALWFTIGGITLTACLVVFLLAFQLFKSIAADMSTIDFQPRSTPRPAITPNLTATQRAWVKPIEYPTLGSAEEVTQALKSKDVPYLQRYALNYPDMPEINQPGDVYPYEVHLSKSVQVLWYYGWCTTTPEILEENFAQMKIEYFVNGTPVTKDHIAITENQRTDGGYCRSYTAIIIKWPEGEHQLETRITFLEPTDDGWNLYPAGMHMFKYFVSVRD